MSCGFEILISKNTGWKRLHFEGFWHSMNFCHVVFMSRHNKNDFQIKWSELGSLDLMIWNYAIY